MIVSYQMLLEFHYFRFVRLNHRDSKDYKRYGIVLCIDNSDLPYRVSHGLPLMYSS